MRVTSQQEGSWFESSSHVCVWSLYVLHVSVWVFSSKQIHQSPHWSFSGSTPPYIHARTRRGKPLISKSWNYTKCEQIKIDVPHLTSRNTAPSLDLSINGGLSSVDTLHWCSHGSSSYKYFIILVIGVLWWSGAPKCNETSPGVKQKCNLIQMKGSYRQTRVQKSMLK